MSASRASRRLLHGTALLALLALPAAFLLKGNSLQAAPAGQKVAGTREAIRTALQTPSYLLLGAGFFVCGFHVAFITTHLPPYLVDKGLDAKWGGWVIALIGLFNIIGSITGRRRACIRGLRTMVFSGLV